MSRIRSLLGKTENFNDAFPDLVTFELTVVQDRFGLYTRDGEPSSETRLTRATIRQHLACVNPRCQQGGLDLTPILGFWSPGQNTSHCQGHEGTPQDDPGALRAATASS